MILIQSKNICGFNVCFLPILACVPNSQHIDRRFLDFVAHLVLADQEAADFAGVELLQAFAHAGVILEAGRRGGERLDDSGGGARIDRS